MPVAEKDLDTSPSLTDLATELPFPPVTKSHVLNCSYHSWYPRYRSHTPRARLIPLSPAFTSYLRADGIILPPDPADATDDDSSDDEAEEAESDPSLAWPEIHRQIDEVIAELGGSVMPKLNWSAPKDATWISATNSMDCRTANDVYLLLKSSDFVVHDLEQVFQGCDDDDEDDEDSSIDKEDDSSLQNHREETDSSPASNTRTDALDQIPYHLILRKTIPALNPSLEFRCFVRSRRLLCICQRDLNHYAFLHPLVPKLRNLIQTFFDKELRAKFPDENFAFDVYIPPPHTRVWLIDINPWAQRTDPLLFSWMEILDMPEPPPRQTELGEVAFVRISMHGGGVVDHDRNGEEEVDAHGAEDGGASEDEEEEEDIFTPEFRLVNRDDPEAYAFNTPQYSAHKLPKDVVDAGVEGEAGLREFMGRWREIEQRQGKEEGEPAEEE